MRNHVHERLTTYQGDCTVVTPTGIADRVVAGSWGESERFLPTAVAALRPGQDGTIHLHDMLKVVDEQEWMPRIASMLEHAGAQLLDSQVHHVKSVTPTLVHYVADLKVHVVVRSADQSP